MTIEYRRDQPPHRLTVIITVLVLVSLACSLTTTGPKPSPVPSTPLSQSTQGGTPLPSQSARTPTALTQAINPLPPVLVEADPLPGSLMALNGTISLAFNQSMDKPSVEGAIQGQPTLSGKFNWTNDRTLVFKPDQPYQPSSAINLTVTSGARAANGLALLQPATIHYTTPDPLQVVQFLPKDRAIDVDPSSAVVASFNQAVVPLGSNASGTSSPAGLILDPISQGKGEWINTSTYVFYPQPSLAGGKTYTVSANPVLTSVAGAVIKAGTTKTWSFTTALPKITAIEPAKTPLRLDGPITLSFNIAMNPASVQSAFSLTDPGATSVAGQFSWDDRGTTLTFTPSALLVRATPYLLTIKGQATSRGGTPLGQDISVTLNTYPELAVIASEPTEGQAMKSLSAGFGTINLTFNVPLTSRNLQSYFSFTPEVSLLSAYQDPTTLQVSLSGYFQANSKVALSISPDLPDAWGKHSGQAASLNFTTPQDEPSFTISAGGSGVVYLTPKDKSLQAQVVNLTSLNLSLSPLSSADFLKLAGPQGYELRNNFSSVNTVSWTYKAPPGENHSHVVELPVSANDQPLRPGWYFLRIMAPELQKNGATGITNLLIAISPIQVTFKLSPDQALVWAAAADGGNPASNAAVSILDENGGMLAAGKTGQDGLVTLDLPLQQNLYQTYYAMVGQPGDADFGVAISSWSQGLAPDDFGISAQYDNNPNTAYIYTDRPIYRPGQTVYYRAILRSRDNGRYKLPDFTQVKLTILGGSGISGQAPVLFEGDQPLSAFGDLHGSLVLPADAAPGSYQISLGQGKETLNTLSFVVADYRKPQVNLSVSLAPQAILSGQELQAKVNASYFFGAPAGGLALHWVLYREGQSFDLAGYQVGPVDDSWLLPVSLSGAFAGSNGNLVAQGDNKTAPDGSLTLHLTETDLRNSAEQKLTLEVTLRDEGGLPVSVRDSALVHSAAGYIGIHPDGWTGQAGSGLGFDLKTVDWQSNPVGSRVLEAVFARVSWVEQDNKGPFGLPAYTRTSEPLANANPVTGPDGTARLSFTPDKPGIYQLEVKGGGAISQVTIWVGGAGENTWPNLPDQQIHLTADKVSYQPGQTAQVFIPNPFGQKVYALVSVERSRVMQASVITLDGAGMNFSLPLTEVEAPNVFISVTILGQTGQGRPDFRQGYIGLQVEPGAEKLKVTLSLDPPRAVPGQKVTVSIQASDERGKPVQGSFSLSAVDLAVLKLADPNAPGITDFYYSPQPLGTHTSLSLAGYGWRSILNPPGFGRGGGGGQETLVLRQHFKDTAFWSTEILTGVDGKAQVSFDLPDNLTTWQLDVRGLTADTRVGEAQTQIITTKELMIIPETPLFLVAGDHVALAALVYNHTAGDLQVNVELQAKGVDLDLPVQASQMVNVSANGSQKVTWWVTAQTADKADLVFKASSGALQDASIPENGSLPLLTFSAPQTFSTSGMLTGAGDHLEVISLPQSFKAQGGDLRLELSPSLAAVMIGGLEALSSSHDQDTSTLLSRFLPNLETVLSLRAMGVKTPAFEDTLDTTVKEGIANLLNRQNPDGGWSLWPVSSHQDITSDAYLTAYSLYGLSRVSQAGFSVPADALERAQKFLLPIVTAVKPDTQPWALDGLAFQLYALRIAGVKDLESTSDVLYNQRQALSPWGQAFLALTLNSLSKNDDRTKTLVNDLESSGVQTATSLHWEVIGTDWHLPGSPVFTTAVVLDALGQLDPAALGLTGAMAYLMAQRSPSGAWGSSYETAWVVMALTEMLKGTGDLQATYAFSASVNGAPLAKGQAGGPNTLTNVTATLPVANLDPVNPNGLVISRDAGPGGLYYRVDLRLNLPVDTAKPVDHGLSLERAYYPAGAECKPGNCAVLHSAVLGSGPAKPITVHLTLSLPTAMYHLNVQDTIPAGTTIFNPSLKTNQQGVQTPQPGVDYDPANPFSAGWGWWWFTVPSIYDDHILWSADYLPAGTYELVYELIPTQMGEFQIIPAHAWQFYFPEVEGNSAGDLFKVTK